MFTRSCQGFLNCSSVIKSALKHFMFFLFVSQTIILKYDLKWQIIFIFNLILSSNYGSVLILNVFGNFREVSSVCSYCRKKFMIPGTNREGGDGSM
jgi:hypothetical protein